MTASEPRRPPLPNGVIIAALILLPPVGIWLAWARSNWSAGAKSIATLLSAGLLAQAIVGGLPKSRGRAEAKTAAALPRAAEAPTPRAVPATSSPPAPPAVPDFPKIRAENKSFGVDQRARLVVAEYVVTNVGKVAAKLKGCIITIEDGAECRRLGEPEVILRAYTREPAGKGEKVMLEVARWQKLKAAGVVPPGGEATLTWKVPLSGMKGCNLSGLKVGLECSAEPAAGI
jgi:hypothetical protein